MSLSENCNKNIIPSIGISIINYYTKRYKIQKGQAKVASRNWFEIVWKDCSGNGNGYFNYNSLKLI